MPEAVGRDPVGIESGASSGSTKQIALLMAAARMTPRAAVAAREQRCIVGTAARLFGEQGLQRLWDRDRRVPDNFGAAALLGGRHHQAAGLQVTDPQPRCLRGTC